MTRNCDSFKWTHRFRGLPGGRGNGCQFWQARNLLWPRVWRACCSKSTWYRRVVRCRHSHSPKPPHRLGSLPTRFAQLARTIVARTPAVAIASDDNPAIAALNVVLGSVGARGGIVRRSKRAEAYVSADAPHRECARSI